jgi:hypothetical protein
MRYEVMIRDGELDLPPDLVGQCKLVSGNPTDSLVCVNVATQLNKVGQYQFELQAISRQNLDQPAKPIQTDLIQIQPLPSYIASFQLNGQEAAPFYRVPLSLGQPAPTIRLTWNVRGGKTTKVQLLPSPGEVAAQSTIDLPLTQQYGRQMITLQAADTSGKPVTRMITFEIFNPSPNDPNIAAAQAAASTARAVNASNAALLKAIQQSNQQPSPQSPQAATQASGTAPTPSQSNNAAAGANSQSSNTAPILLPSNAPTLSNPRFSP